MSTSVATQIKRTNRALGCIPTPRSPTCKLYGKIWRFYRLVKPDGPEERAKKQRGARSFARAHPVKKEQKYPVLIRPGKALIAPGNAIYVPIDPKEAIRFIGEGHYNGYFEVHGH